MVRKKRKISKSYFLLLCLVCFILILAIAGSLRKAIFQQCVEHEDNSPSHSHTQLKVIQDGKEIEIPSNIGITDNCMHPLHTHDATGLIHMEYPVNVPFFLGDFFNVMGIKFDDTQIGAIRTFDGYRISVYKNKKPVKKLYKWILLKDLDKIEIRIDKTK